MPGKVPSAPGTTLRLAQEPPARHFPSRARQEGHGSHSAGQPPRAHNPSATMQMSPLPLEPYKQEHGTCHHEAGILRNVRFPNVYSPQVWSLPCFRPLPGWGIHPAGTPQGASWQTPSSSTVLRHDSHSYCDLVNRCPVCADSNGKCRKEMKYLQ